MRTMKCCFGLMVDSVISYLSKFNDFPVTVKVPDEFVACWLLFPPFVKRLKLSEAFFEAS